MLFLPLFCQYNSAEVVVCWNSYLLSSYLSSWYSEQLTLGGTKPCVTGNSKFSKAWDLEALKLIVSLLQDGCLGKAQTRISNTNMLVFLSVQTDQYNLWMALVYKWLKTLDI